MPPAAVDRFYQWLAQAPTPDADQILACALPEAESVWADRITRVLLQRNGEQSWAGLIGRYERLPRDVREHLRSDPPKMYAAISLAMRARLPAARAGALAALSEIAPPCLAFLIPPALRDPVPKMRVVAGRVLRRMCERLLDRPPGDTPEQRAAWNEDKRHLVQALLESIRSVDMHGRIEVLEAALWFAADLQAELWEALNARRSRASAVVREHIYEWNSPRLAAFLLLALQQSGWREASASILQGWRDIPQVIALLEAGATLDRRALRASLNWIGAPRWFEQLGDDLSALPEAVRPLVPWWVPYLGMADDVKVATLSRLLRGADRRVHRAAVYAFAELRSSEALRAIRNLAESQSPLAAFARWFIAGRTGAPPARPTAASPAPTAATTPRAGTNPKPPQPSDPYFSRLWGLCRRTPPDARDALIRLFRAHHSAWSDELAMRLMASDPRDRLLALQILSSAELIRASAKLIACLRDDPVEGIRRLAARAMDAARSAPEPSPPSTPLRAKRNDDEGLAVAREDLESLLSHLCESESSPEDVEQIERLCELVAEVLAGRTGELAAGAAR